MQGIIIGYGRVSTTDQGLGVQEDALRAAGCAKLFMEQVSGSSTKNRDELARCLAFAREGDTIVVTRVDRLGRSVSDLLRIIEDLAARGIHFRCINQPIFDVNEATSKLFFTLLAGFAEFETNIRRERQAEGIARAKAAGTYAKRGAKPKWDSRKVIAAVRDLREKYPGLGAAKCARLLGMPKRSLYRYTKDANPPIWGPAPNSEEIVLTEGYDVVADATGRSQ